MKTLLASALVVGVAIAESAYYIGNYTANGQVNLVPYPLGVCVPTGAVSGFTYSTFTCYADSVEQRKFDMTDTTCSGAYTAGFLPKAGTGGVEGYTICDGPVSYMTINQYVSNCNLWKQGKTGIATTVVAADACTWTTTVGDVPVYSRSLCDGDMQQLYYYAGDNTCSINDAIVDFKQTSSNCNHFTDQGSLKIYSALIKCVVDEEVQRCETPLANYEAMVSFEGVDSGIDYTQVYEGLFEYATVDTFEMNDTLHLTLSFCTQYEDSKYADSVADLGVTTLSSSYISDSAKVCWSCVEFSCANSSRCGDSDYCVNSEQCTTTTTETANSANVVYTSFAVMMGLLLSWTLF